MANKEFFISQIDRLKSNWSESHFKPECVGFIWQEVKHVNDQDLRAIVDDFIADRSYPPKRMEFREAISTRRLNRYQVEKEQRSQEMRVSNLSQDEIHKGLKHIYLSLCESLDVKSMVS